MATKAATDTAVTATTATTATIGGIDLQYVQGLSESSEGAAYAALQCSKKQPSDDEDQGKFAIMTQSLPLLSDNTIGAIKSEIKTVKFDDEPVELMLIKPTVRFVITKRPVQFLYNRIEKTFHESEGDQIESGSGLCTACKLHVAIVVDNKVMLSDSGIPELLTLKMMSMNMGEFIGGKKRSKPGDGTLYSLNTGLKTFYEQKTKQKLTGVPFYHLVSVDLKPVPVFRKSAKGSSWAWKFTMGSAKELDIEGQKLMYELVSSNEEFLADYKDPFNILRSAKSSAPESDEYEDEDVDPTVTPLSDIPF